VVKQAHRKSFASQEKKRLRVETGLPFELHSDVSENGIDLRKTPFVIVQYECNHLLRSCWGLGGRKLIVLCDEWNSVMRQMESHAGCPKEDMFMFNCLLEKSTHCLFMDACTTTHSIKACQAFLKAAGQEVSHLLCGRGHQIPMSTNCNYIKRIKCSWSTLGIH
jgi:hypothetical protein